MNNVEFILVKDKKMITEVRTVSDFWSISVHWCSFRDSLWNGFPVGNVQPGQVRHQEDLGGTVCQRVNCIRK